MSSLLLSLLLIFGIFNQNINNNPFPSADFGREDGVISEIISEIKARSLYDIDEGELHKQIAISTLLSLGDEYFDVRKTDEEEFSDFDMGNNEDLGLVIDSVEHQGGMELRIVDVLSKSGAKMAGLRPGDIILEVNGVKTKGSYLIYDGAVELETEDKKLLFKIDRLGQIMDIKAEIKPYEQPVLETKILNDEIYYLDINYFDWDTADVIYEELKKFKDYKFDKLLIDLRGNLGGDLDAAVAAASFFFDDEVVCYYKTREGIEEVKRTEDRLIFDSRIAILISENTASSAELFAKALRNKAGATLVGRTSYGKDIGQEFFEINGLEIKLTTLAISTNRDEFMTHEGIVPNIVIEEPLFSERGDEALLKAMNVLE